MPKPAQHVFLLEHGPALGEDLFPGVDLLQTVDDVVQRATAAPFRP